MRTIVDHDVEVPAFDGTVLATDVHRPVVDRTIGCLLQRVPYGKDVPAIVHGALDVDRAVARGYAVAVQDCRGRGRSDGDFVPFRAEADDGEATIRWLAEQPWCNGRVGMFGRSYGGVAQWLVARREVPALRAIAPMFSGHDPLSGWLCPDGSVEWGFALLWCIRYLAPEQLARRDGDAPMTAVELVELIDRVDDVLRARPEDVSLDAVIDLVPLLGEVIALERSAGRYDLGDGGPGPDLRGGPPSQVPALVIGGWFDVFLGGTLDSAVDVAAAGVPSRLVVGPWAHGGTCPGVFPEIDFGAAASAAAVRLTDVQLDWFDRWMADDPAPGASGAGPSQVAAAGPPARLFVTGRDEWVDEPSWPPTDVEVQRWALVPDVPDGTVAPAGLAGLVRPSVSAGIDAGSWSLTWDEDRPVPTLGGQTFLPGLDVAANAGPRRQDELLARDDVLAAVGPLVPAGAPVDVLGEVWVVLAVSDAPAGTRWCARLVDVGPDGWVLLAEAAARPPGEVDAVSVHLRGVAHRVRPGHRIGLLVSHSSSPRFGPPVHAGGAGARRGATRVRFGPSAPSYVDLPVRTTCPSVVDLTPSEVTS